MKDLIMILLLFASAIFLFPVIVNGTGSSAPTGTGSSSPVFPDTVSLYLTESGETVKLPAEEYIEGCLAAQIAINYEPEALKAQASASATYAMRLMSELSGSGKLPDGADISDDPRLCQPYMPEAERESTYGTDYGKYRGNLREAALWGISHIITYENRPIYAVYHSVSAGGTCPSEYIWNTAFPYLRSAESPWDESCPTFVCTNEMRSEEIRYALAQYDSAIEIPADPARWFTELNADENGYVISVKIGSNTFSGGDLWRILGLRSTAFTVTCTDGIFTFTTRGFGHGAGLSQYGANAMAASGSTAADILHHYYGTDIMICGETPST